MVRRISSSIFVGRFVERAGLEAGLDAAVRGEAGLVLIGGDAGIGKSRLAAEFTVQAEARDALVLRGRCFEAKAASLAFAPFVEIFRPLLVGERKRGEPPTPEAGHSPLARLVPELATAAATDRRSPADDERLSLFESVRDLFGRAAADRPLVIVIEDLHWADESSLDLLRFVVERLGEERLLLVATFRTDELQRQHPLLTFLGELVRLAHVTRLDLAAFTEAEVADQLTGITGGRPPPDLIQRVHARSDGNPFFVEEVMGLATDDRLPATLRDVLGLRLATLSPDARAVVMAAAAVGRDVTQQLIGRIAALPDDRLREALRDAVDHHALVPSDARNPAGFAFRHALIQELAYEELLPSERIALHRAIARSLRDDDGPAGEIARNAALGHDVETALIYAVRAADEALEARAFAEALIHAERALELWNAVAAPESLSGRDERSLLALAARCADALGRWSRAAALGRAALAHLDPIERRDERIVALLDLSRWEMLADDEAARAATILEAAELVRSDQPSELRARVLTELAHLANHRGRIDEARRLAEEALEMSRSIGARAEEARALVRLADSVDRRMQPAAAADMLAEAEGIAAEGHAPFDDFVGYLVFQRVGVALSTGGFARAIEIADAGMARAARTGRLGQRAGFLRAMKVWALGALGRWAEAEALVEEEKRDGSVITARISVQNFIHVLIRQGRVGESAEAVRAIDFDYVVAEDGWLNLECRIRVAIGERRWDDARAAAEEVIGLLEDPPRDAGVLLLLELCVGAEADRADLARGRRRAVEAAEARRVGLALLALGRGPVEAAIALGGAGPLTEAILATGEAEGSRLEGRPDAVRWDDVARRRESLDQPWETAYARFRQAEAILMNHGHKHETMPSLREAHRIASQLGARPLTDQIEKLARRGRIRLAGASPASRSRQGTSPEGVVVGLTTREWEVLSMVAVGHTNREIGAELFISEKTASVHITNAMNKLGALSRYDAAAIATRLGLIDSSAEGSATR